MPPGEANPALAGARILCFLNALREIDGLANAGANLVDRLLAVLVPWRLLPGKPGGCAFGVIAGALDLVDEILHVGGKAAGQEYADVKPLCRGMLFGLVEPGLEVLQGLDALSNYWVIHASPPLWCDIPSKAVRFIIVDDADRLNPGVVDAGPTDLETALPHGILNCLGQRGFCWHRLAVARYDALVDHGFAVRPTSRQNRRVGNA